MVRGHWSVNGTKTKFIGALVVRIPPEGGGVYTKDILFVDEH